MHFACDPQQPDRSQRRDGQDDELDRRFESDQRFEQPDEQVDAQIADEAPVEIIPVVEPWRLCGVP